ncbi:hypothetical protein EG68_02140 [Paragonimus skrjabini miyazakii]|uniref:Uncharacterized protein n=1 Tax=Paragonimus skrjabini miyazakii TaxID=59628 RepID=A0A8S9YZA8_9TREM|nr:hypothetical protein EG68_02140 [Paragonimus skrjabini miyazakii]
MHVGRPQIPTIASRSRSKQITTYTQITYSDVNHGPLQIRSLHLASHADRVGCTKLQLHAGDAIRNQPDTHQHEQANHN